MNRRAVVGCQALPSECALRDMLATDRLRSRVQVPKERTVKLPSHTNPTYNRLDLEDSQKNIDLIVRQLAT